MGRSGGGGGGHSSGGFSGGHSSGGFSGGGRSSGGSFGGSSGGFGGFGGGGRSSGGSFSGGHHSYGGRTTYSSGSGPFMSGPGRGPSYRRHRSGCTLPSIIVILIIIVLIAAFAQTRNGSNTAVENTTERTALSGVVNKTDWYDDQLGWVSSKNTMITGLENFYNQTGVQPYILIVKYDENLWNTTELNAANADAYLEEYYGNHFTDEGHFLFAYFSCANDSRAEMDGEFRYLSGHTADTIMDNEAIKVLWGYFEENYNNTSLTMEQMFSDTFTSTAKNIMSKPTNGWDFAKILIIIVGVIAVAVIIFLLIKSKHKRDKEKEEYTKEILDKPLDTFGTDTSELEDKYK